MPAFSPFYIDKDFIINNHFPFHLCENNCFSEGFALFREAHMCMTIMDGTDYGIRGRLYRWKIGWKRKITGHLKP